MHWISFVLGVISAIAFFGFIIIIFFLRVVFRIPKMPTPPFPGVEDFLKKGKKEEQ